MHIIIWVFYNIYFLSKLFFNWYECKDLWRQNARLFKKIHNLKLRPHLFTLLLQHRTFFLLTLQWYQQDTFPPLLGPIFIFSPSNSIERPKYNAFHSKNPNGVFSKLARRAYFPSEKMPLIDLYVETAAGDQNHCARFYFIRTCASIMIPDKQQDPGRDTQRRPNRQTDTDKTQQELQDPQPCHLKWKVSDNPQWIGARLRQGGAMGIKCKCGGSGKACSLKRLHWPWALLGGAVGLLVLIPHHTERQF